jgi:hypothetical protein
MEHCPATQLDVPSVGGVQTVPQLPQLALLLVRSTHWLWHAESPVLQEKPQVPALHVGFPPVGALHTWPQLPQFAGSRLVSAHEPLQLLVPVAQLSVHVPCEQVELLLHAVAQAPQCAASDERSLHTPPQFV